VAWRFCTVCERFLEPERIPWHSQRHPEMRTMDWVRDCCRYIWDEDCPPGTEIVPICPRCDGRDILDVAMVPQGAKAERHIMGEDGVVAENICWDDKFEQPPEEHRYWCQDCEAYVKPEWEKVK
jgi:hypothetical protein